MNLRRVGRIVRPYLPNHLPFGRVALVALRAGRPLPSVIQPISATQILGGRRWSLALIRIAPHERVPEPTPDDPED